MKRSSKVFAVIGDPVSHSLSPIMHEAAFADLGLLHRYVALRVPSQDLESALNGAKALGLTGLNLTVPHKQSALRYMDTIGVDARAIGAANTITFSAGKIHGDNTDGRGFIAALNELEGDVPRRATILGAGGAAAAIVHGLLSEFAELEINWVSRTPDKIPQVSPRVRAQKYDFVQAGQSTTDLGQLLVNCTSVGLQGNTQTFPVKLGLDRLDRAARVIDIVYPRSKGGLLDQAQNQGLSVQDGVTMLLWQGVFALQIWLKKTIEQTTVKTMRNALAVALDRKS